MASGTQLFINDLPLDESQFAFPLYRGTEARKFKVYGFGPRWPEYKALVSRLAGGFATLKIRGARLAGPHPGVIKIDIPEIIVLRATRVNEVSVELECYDSRILLREAVNALDFNMLFGGDYLEGTEFSTYRAAIEKFCRASAAITARLAPDAFSGIPDRNLENNVHLAALLAPDPLAYLCDRAGCDLTIGIDGKWYFASRDDATPQWFRGFEEYNWRVRPGFMALETITTRKPRQLLCYYWEHHTLRIQGVDSSSTATTYGADELKVELEWVYFDDTLGIYSTLSELLTNHSLTGLATDATIAKAFLVDSAQGCQLHPLDTFDRKTVWAIIKRDFRKLARISFPNGSTGGWDEWRFGKIQEDGSVEPVSIECPWVEFTRVVSSDSQGSLEGRPWTFNHNETDEKSPFKATWDDGPESGVIRFAIEDSADRLRDLLPPMPGVLVVPRQGGGYTAQGVSSVGGGYDNALRIIAKNKVDNNEGSVANLKAIDHLRIFGREDLSKAQLASSFTATIYLTGRKFLPNSSSRWHLETATGFANGDIEYVELPPSHEVQCYRTYVGGDHNTGDWFEADGMGLTLNNLEVKDDAERRAEVWKLSHCMSAEGEGHADTLNLATRKRLIDGPIAEAALHVDGIETYTTVRVGNLADDKARQMTAQKRITARKIDVQGVRR